MRNQFLASMLFLKVFCILLWGLAPIWGILALIITGLGIVVGILEHIGIVEGIYFGWVTATTIGYGDIVPTGPLSRLLSIFIALIGIVNTGLAVTLAVTAGTKVAEYFGVNELVTSRVRDTISEVEERTARDA